jgi:transposase
MRENYPDWRKELNMRGDRDFQGHLFSYISLEDRVPADHPLRPLKLLIDEVLERLSGEFDKLYSKHGRPSVPPEQLLKALLLQSLYTIRSERQLMEQLDYNLLFRWFVGLNMDDEVWNATTFTKNRDRLLKGDIASKFFDEVLVLARGADLLSSEHFTVDGTLLEAWAGHKSFKPKETDDKKGPPKAGGKLSPEIEKAVSVALGRPQTGENGRNKDGNFHGQKRCNDTHQSTTDPDARLFKKGREGAKLSFMGHILTENRNGLVVDTRVTRATGTAEVEAAEAMLSDVPGDHRITVGADKGFDQRELVKRLREMNVTPHVAQNDTNRRSAIDDRTTRHAGYVVSQRKRKRVEEVFGWAKTVGGVRKMKHKGLALVGWVFKFTAAAYNLVRIRNLMSQDSRSAPAVC